jgi:hypothetical protein
VLEAGASGTFFPGEYWVSFWKEYVLQIIDFLVEKCSFCSKMAYSAELKTLVALQRQPSMLHAPASYTFFSGEVRVRFERNPSCNVDLSRWFSALFLPSRRIQLRWRNTWISPKKPPVLDPGTSSILFPCENCFRFWKEYVLQLSGLNEVIGSLCFRWAYSANLREHISLSKNIHLFHNWSIEHIVARW